MMNFVAIQKSSTPQMVAEQILQRIESGSLPIGTRLPPQRVLAEQLAVGRSSIREAINALVVMGYLEVRQGSGTYVLQDKPVVDTSLQQLAAAFDAVDLLDLMEAREMLECKSAALAAERADPKQIRKLRQHLKKVEDTKEDYGIFLAADIEFHILIAVTADNPVLEELIKLVLGKLIRQHKQLKTSNLSSKYRLASISSAKEIARAIENGNSSDAAHWMKVHLDAIRSELKEII